MMLGEINYIDNFVGGGTYPFQTDSYILIIVFCLIMPLALMNFLVSNHMEYLSVLGMSH